jgi:hypothetical protein
VIPGDTTGTWATDSTLGLVLNIAMMAGSSRVGTANAWAASNFKGVTGTTNGAAATSDFMNLAGASLVPGMVPLVATRLPTILRPFDNELLLCQRYYEKSFDYATAPAQNAGINLGESSWTAVKAGAVSQRTATKIMFKVKKRISGTRTYYNPQAANAFARDIDATADCSATATTIADEHGFHPTVTANASTAVGNLMAVHWVTDSRFTAV